MKWYQCQGEDVCQAFQVKEDGLHQAVIEKNRERYGTNELVEEQKQSLFIVFLKQFQDLLVLVLLAAAIISMISGELISTLVIIFVVTMNAVLGTIQYQKAEKSIQALKQMTSPVVKVIREGVLQEICDKELVCGDLVLLEAGDMISADGRILSCTAFQVNESALSGEVLPVEKTSDPIQEEVGLSDQRNMVFSGSFVVNGRARVVVSAVGMNTELGKIAKMMEQVKQTKTPLQRSMDDTSKKLSVIVMLVCVIVFFLQLIQGAYVLDALMFAVALAVAAIPEALASIVTIVLALGAQKMVKEHAVMKQLYSVETLGSVSVICTDKTGTLTQNKMSVVQTYVDETTYDTTSKLTPSTASLYLMQACVLCNDATITLKQRLGDPMELALLDYVEAQSIPASKIKKEYPRISELPFDSIRKCMSTLHEINGQRLLFVKGAPDVLLSKSSSYYHKDSLCHMSEQDKQTITSIQHASALQGQRVLGFAYRILDHDEIEEADEADLIFLGLVSLMDPPRKESRDAVKACHQAGIKTIMMTGDHKDTAYAIACQTGIIEHDHAMCITGKELDAYSEEALEQHLLDISVYARVEPKHKQRIIQAFQRRGYISAMTGDGVNDAPALKQADIGIAMGITGTEVSKDAADMILMDDNFATIVKAVASGRTMVRNIKHAIGYLLSGNFGAILCVFGASLCGLPVPFLPIHLLFINLIGDSLPAIAIGLEPSDPEVLQEPVRDSRSSLLDQALFQMILIQGSLIAFMTMVAYAIGLMNDQATAQTMAFATLCLSRMLHGLTSRSHHSLLHIGITTNKASLIACLFTFVLLLCILYFSPLQYIFQLSSLSLPSFAIVVACALTSFLCIQCIRVIKEHKK